MQSKPERMWAEGEFYKDWARRAEKHLLLHNNIQLFSRALVGAENVNTVLEIGAGTGANLEALQALRPWLQLTGIDINPAAVSEMKQKGFMAFRSSAAEYRSSIKHDLVLTKGLLIHIPADQLPGVYRKIFDLSDKYILLCEYYDPKPTEIIYHGQAGVLWKRDFAGEMLDMFPDSLYLVNYGFVYHREDFPQDDLTWFLLKKY